MAVDEATQAELVWVQADFDELATNAPGERLRAPSHGTKWTNQELLFHLWFGMRIARVFIPLIGGFSRLPPGASRGWARLLTTATKPYERINYIASAAGGGPCHWPSPDAGCAATPTGCCAGLTKPPRRTWHAACTCRRAGTHTSCRG